MPLSILNSEEMPYCPGCGHRLAISNIARALEQMRIDPLDVIIVSDIGCCGIVDRIVKCHTMHGLHGRCVALGIGLSLGLDDPEKKIIAIQGDGGATIGLRHLLEAARQNVDMTLIVQSNMVYGMTGGQVSGLSTCEFKNMGQYQDDCDIPPYEIVELAAGVGAAYGARVVGRKDFTSELVEAIGTRGFSVVENLGLCPPYGLKKTRDLELHGQKEVVLRNDRLECTANRKQTKNLLDQVPRIEAKYHSNLKSKMEIIIAGSAGEGSQLAGDLLARTGISADLCATKTGAYPITVGSGFSLSEIIISREHINYSGIESPDLIIITSEDGLEMARERIEDKTTVLIDDSLEVPDHDDVVIADFRNIGRKNGAALCAVAFWMQNSGILPMEALLEHVKAHKHAEKLMSAIEGAGKLTVKEL